MNLYEWTKEFIKYKDVIFKRIKTIKFLDTTIHVEEKNGTKKIYFVCENIQDGLAQIDTLKDEKGIITTLNTSKNVSVLIKEWDSLLKNKKDVTILFSHPGTNEEWMIHPKTHAKISEKEKLSESINILFNSISKV